MLKVEIHLEISVPSDHLDVNQIVALSQEVQAQVGPALVAHCLETVQDLELDRVLGPRWADVSQYEAPWVCPQCRSRQGFSRRGSRPRTLRKTSVGRVPFNLRQVTCHQCNDTFAPFPTQLVRRNLAVGCRRRRLRRRSTAVVRHRSGLAFRSAGTSR